MCTRSRSYRGATLNRWMMNPMGNYAPQAFPRMHDLINNKKKERKRKATLSLSLIIRSLYTRFPAVIITLHSLYDTAWHESTILVGIYLSSCFEENVWFSFHFFVFHINLCYHCHLLLPCFRKDFCILSRARRFMHKHHVANFDSTLKFISRNVCYDNLLTIKNLMIIINIELIFYSYSVYK